MFEVSVSDWFVATHRLPRGDGTLEPAHEHRWRVSVTFAGRELNSQGVLVDFAQLRHALREVLATLQQRSLNELGVLADRVPSAENIAAHVAGRLAGLNGPGVRLRLVEVEEAPGCVARFLPETAL